MVLDEDERVILVDEHDRPLREGDKLGTHREGALHRAFSVFLLRPDGRLVIQKRADCKYHSRGKWGNSCCGHPRPGESSREAAERRLPEEIGIRTTLNFAFTARYRAELDGHMVENEIVHIYFGIATARAALNPLEASAVRDVSFLQLRREMDDNRQDFAAWLLHYMDTHGPLLELCRDLELDGKLSGRRPARGVGEGSWRLN